MRKGWSSAWSAGVAASIALLALSACGRSAAPSCKCGPAEAPPSSVALTIDDQHYSGQPGQLLTFRRPLQVKKGRRLHFGVRIKATDGVHVGDVWLMITSAPYGFGAGGPRGKYRLILHHAGTVNAARQLAGSWRATPLFNTHGLDLSLYYTVGDHLQGWAIAHLTVLE